MDRKQLESQTGAIGFGVIIAVVIGVAALGWVLYQQTRVSSLQKELEDTKGQLEQVTQATQQAAEGVAGALAEGAGDIASAIAGIDNPVLRLELFKAYADRIRDSLSADAQEELDEVVVYVEKNMTVLMTPNPDLPEEIAASIAKIKEELAAEETDEIASTQMESEEAAKLKVGAEVEVTGVLNFAGVDPVTGAGVFTMNTAEGMTLYFTFSPANTSTYQAQFNGKEVTMTLEITAIEEDVVLYDVTEGPELAATPAPTEADEEEAEVTPEAEEE
jgi:hypothetical protein